MVLSKRERVIVVAAVAVVALFVLDRLVLSRLLDARQATLTTRDKLAAEVQRLEATLKLERALAPRWDQMRKDGMMTDPAEAESQVLHALSNWAKSSGVTWTQNRPERPKDKTVLPEISFYFAGTGDIQALYKFLLSVQAAPIPLAIEKLSITGKDESSSSRTVEPALRIDLYVSTVYAQPMGPASQPADQALAQGGR